MSKWNVEVILPCISAHMCKLPFHWEETNTKNMSILLKNTLLIYFILDFFCYSVIPPDKKVSLTEGLHSGIKLYSLSCFGSSSVKSSGSIFYKSYALFLRSKLLIMLGVNERTEERASWPAKGHIWGWRSLYQHSGFLSRGLCTDERRTEKKDRT